MRLHRLAMTAFGPFGTTQEVDFDELSSAGLFLLHGPTGAGKTSVLDAVCYGLYGQVPGARQGSGLSLRSDHADPHTPTEVVLELTVGGRRLEITRRPEQPRPKKRGTGTTREKAQSRLREYLPGAGEWKALSRSHQEIGEEISQLLGMSKEQFCQVVLLPQGDFARFLRADEMARGKLLGKLFDTGRFAAVEERLAELRRAAEKQVVGGDERLLALAHRMAQAAGPAPGPDGHALPDLAPGEPGLADAVLEWAAIARTTARERQDIALAAVQAVETAHQAARRTADAERERARLQRRHAEARHRADELERGRAEHDLTRARLERARAADAVVPALELHAAAERDHTAATTAEHTARTRLAAEPDLELQPTRPMDAPASGETELPRPRRAEGEAEPRAGAAPGAEGRTEPPGATRYARATGAAAEHSAPESPGAEPGRGVGTGRPSVVSEQDSRECGGLSDVACGGGERFAAGRLGAGEGPQPGAGGGGIQRCVDAPGVAGDGSGCAGGTGGSHAVPEQGFEGRDGSLDAALGAGRPIVGSPGAGAGSGLGPRAHSGGPGLAGAGAARLADEERRLREELGSLGAARRAERRAGEVAAEVAGLDRQARADEEAIEEAGQWLAGWETARQAHTRRVEAAQEAVTRAEQLAGQLAPARQRLDAARRRDLLAGEATEAEQRLLRSREEAAVAHETWLDLKDRRLRGIAAELAAGLSAGEPCAVCGATEHPRPARPGAGHVDRTAEEAALAVYRRAEAGREEAERRLQSLREALAGAEAAAGGGTADELDRAVADLETALAGARGAGADGHAAREALAHAEEEHERRLAQRQEAERRAAARTSRREALLRERAGLLAELERARGGAVTVAERAARLERHAGLLARAAEAAREAEAAARRLEEAGARLVDAARRAGFDTPSAAAGAVLPATNQRGLRHRLEQWQTESAAVAAELADPLVAAAAQEPPADPGAAEAAAEAATRALREASARDAAARTRCQELDRLSAQAVTDARRLAPLREEHDRLARLATLAAGTSAENERRMRLEAYVLAARLEQVAAAASARLRHMSAGRYTLVHSDARTGGRGRAGLGLHVIDAWTGSERDTATLSGGETFFVSLSLALGLADVVTDEAGGTRLDTLFIDEGFGSLDEQTLDEVLDVLDSLRERDRTVGIVSHVADLRQRIPVRLEVVKGRDGSAVRHRTAGAGGRT
ncbi:AAA family ATPase [Streptomyces sp. ME19-01-6]|uniref:AAA family ATPase n=1 Tax=Streptomyces sp. ME19-01-6 TaxID=3028686 RepID=UPI0029B4B7E1|nr:AAA family ATPase [Streptomyces sp. ME19-01-6]MDX3232023.1 AAA family ATPase [Streptomyces sp. ME19-01-6]